MREIFQKWLFVFVAAAFAVVFLSSFFFQTQQSRRNAQYLIHLRLQDIREQIKVNQDNLKSVMARIGDEARSKARAVAEMIRLDPALVQDTGRLQQLASNLMVDEIHVSDQNGILVASYPPYDRYKNFDMASSAQSREFMPAITNPEFELVQGVREQGAGGELVQYTGVARKDQPGIVQVAYTPDRLIDAIKLADIANLALGQRIGSNGHIIICRGNTIVSAQDQALIGHHLKVSGLPENKIVPGSPPFESKINGISYLGCCEQAEDLTIIGIIPENEMYASRDELAIGLTVAHLTLFGVVFILVSSLVQKIVINGIYGVNRSLRKITDGDLNEKVHVQTNREFRELSEGINLMVDSLKQAVEEAARRIDRELALAHDIQTSVLPRVFPPFPDRSEFSIFATSVPAKVVGGDFYDLFLIDDDHLCFVIADVSGKGIPAALFMMTTKTLINNHAKTGIPSNEVFDRTNSYLCENNETTMFVTAFIGVLEISTGKLTVVSAGHNPPLIRLGRKGYDWVQAGGGIILGVDPSLVYGQSVLQLSPGDTIYLYTDGVSEAMDKNEQLFGEERLIQLLNRPDVVELDPTELLPRVAKELDHYRQGAEPSDDVTMMAVCWNGPSPKSST